MNRPGVPDAGGIAMARHDSALGWWEIASRPPAPGLRGHVLDYVGFREDTQAPLRRREVPHGGITLILSFGEPIRLLTLSARQQPSATFTSFVAGLHDAPVLTEHDGQQHGLEVRLTPLGGYALFGVPMHELANAVVRLDELPGGGLAALVPRLAEAPGWGVRFALVDAFLAERLAAGPQPSPTVAWAWWQMVRASGQLAVGGLAKEIGWSRRHLAAQFREQVGLAPKTVARVLRFQRAVRLLSAGDRAGLADVALACGYYDQAHLNRDFRAFTGCTPTEFLGAALPHGAGVSGDGPTGALATSA